MTDVMANLFVDVNLSKVKLTLFLEGNCFLIESAVSEHYLWQMLLRVLGDGSTSSLRNALSDHYSLWFGIAFPQISAQTNPNTRQ